MLRDVEIGKVDDVQHPQVNNTANAGLSINAYEEDEVNKCYSP